MCANAIPADIEIVVNTTSTTTEDTKLNAEDMIMAEILNGNSFE